MAETKRTVAELWERWKPRARSGTYPFDYTTYEDNEAVMSRLTSFDRDAWAAAYSDAAGPFEDAARKAEASGDTDTARDNYLHAYGLYRMARFPTTNSPGKMAAYRKSQEMYLAASPYMAVPLERIEIPFKGRAGEGATIPAYLGTPSGVPRPPVLVLWSGIDTFKEDRTALVAAMARIGVATLVIDQPGTGDCPLKGSEDGERLWDPIFAWIDGRDDLDSTRIAAWGLSTGGYWAAKIAHTHADRLVGSVDQGGCAHFAFTEDWIAKAQQAEYPYELAETLAYAFGGETYDDWVDRAPAMSLLDQGILDRPCAPLLLINGVKDSIFPIEDMHLLLEHGSPKDARFYPVGHMGNTPETVPTIIRWLAARFGVAPPG